MRTISKRAQKALAEAGEVSAAVRELILFAAQNPGLSRYEFASDAEYRAAANDAAVQWKIFRAVLSGNDVSRITDRAIKAAANDRLVWDKKLGRWQLTQDADYRQEAINLLLRAMKG